MNSKNLLNINQSLPIDGFRVRQVAGIKEVVFHLIDRENIIETAHSHDFFVLILFEKGKGTHQIDSVDYPIGDKELHVLFPEQMHAWHINHGTIAYQLMIQRDFFEQFAPYFRFSFTNYQNNPVIRLTLQNYNLLHYELQAIATELQKQNPLPDLIRARAGVIAAITSLQAQENFTEFKVYQSNSRLAKYNMLIDKYYKEHKAVSFFAKQLGVSANYLNVLCKKQLKVSAGCLINQRVITQAKRMLLYSDLDIKQIAYDLGFSDQAYFTRIFKNQTSMSPSAFRKNK
ncbi:helix-turn-helix domain-containing protein [Myroides sp. LJL119]